MTRVSPIKDFTRGIFDGPHATPAPSDSGPIFLGIKNVTVDGRLDLSEIRHVSSAQFPQWTRRVMPEENDIVFSYEATLHLYARIPKGFEGCLGRRMALVRPDTDKVDPRFLLYYFLSPTWRAKMDAITITGATVNRIPLTTFPHTAVSFPSLAKQEGIAAVLSDYDDLIENNRKRMRLLEEAARLLYREWFVHFRFPGHEHVKIVDGVPEGWQSKVLADACLSLEDGDWIETKDQGGSDYRLLQISNIGLNEFIETGNFRFITEDTYRRLNCRELLPDHILIARMPKPIGRAWLVTDMPWKMITAVDGAIAVADPKCADPYFLTYSINSPANLALCERRAVGATRPRITRRDVASLPLIVPPLRFQKLFRDVVEPLNGQRKLLQRQSERLAVARDLLLPRLISGEIAV